MCRAARQGCAYHLYTQAGARDFPISSQAGEAAVLPGSGPCCCPQRPMNGMAILLSNAAASSQPSPY